VHEVAADRDAAGAAVRKKDVDAALPNQLIPGLKPSQSPAPLPISAAAGIYILHRRRQRLDPPQPRARFTCGDGIDIGLGRHGGVHRADRWQTPRSIYPVGPSHGGILSILAVGMQTRDTSRLHRDGAGTKHPARHRHANSNTRTRVRHPNVVDASTIVAGHHHNRCYNSVGGWSVERRKSR